MTILKFCCCCCRLQTGAVILGYIETFVSLISMIIAIVIAIKSDTIANSLNEIVRDANPLQQPTVYFDGKALQINAIMVIVVSLIWILISVVLIIGATKRNPRLITPYLGFKIIFFLFSIYQYIVILINQPDKLSTSISLVIFIGLSVYLWLCVFSLFQELREQQNAPREAYLMQQQPYNPQVYKPSTIPN